MESVAADQTRSMVPQSGGFVVTFIERVQRHPVGDGRLHLWPATRSNPYSCRFMARQGRLKLR